MTGEAGYTLVETLAALMVIGLAVVGLSTGAQVLQRRQTAINSAVMQTQASRSAQAALDRVLERSGPYRSQDVNHISGDGQSLKIDCGEPAPCAFEIVQGSLSATLALHADGANHSWRLPVSGRTHFVYSGALDTGEVWPPSSGRRQALRSVAIAEELPTGAVALATARLWLEEPQTCAFDPVLQDCR